MRNGLEKSMTSYAVGPCRAEACCDDSVNNFKRARARPRTADPVEVDEEMGNAQAEPPAPRSDQNPCSAKIWKAIF